MIYENPRFLKRYREIKLDYFHPIYGMQWKTHHDTLRELIRIAGILHAGFLIFVL